MAAAIDLKSLTDETITQMGYESHDLWLVKIGSIVFGPYETESLKHYVLDNEHLFDEALASRMDVPSMKPFWTHAVFQRRQPQVVNHVPHQDHFWLMESGTKTGPFKFEDIDKKIVTGLVDMSDHISLDDGQTWKKIFEIHGLDRRTHGPKELPNAPFDSVFEKAKLALIEKMDQPHVNLSNEIASIAHLGHQQAKVIQFKLEEMTIKVEKRTEVSHGVKWMMPTAVAVVLTLVTSGYFLFSSSPEQVSNVQENEPTKVVSINRKNPRPYGQMPNLPRRSPGSTSYSQPPSYNTSRYPTHMETHEEYREQPQESPVFENDQQLPQEEHSLVVQDNPDGSVDAAMNGIDQPVETPVIEEASDF